MIDQEDKTGIIHKSGFPLYFAFFCVNIFPVHASLKRVKFTLKLKLDFSLFCQMCNLILDIAAFSVHPSGF